MTKLHSNKENFESLDYEDMIDGFEILNASISGPEDFQIMLKECLGDDDGTKTIYDFDSRVLTYSPSRIKSNNGFHISNVYNVGYFHSIIFQKEGRTITLTDMFEVGERDTGYVDIGKPREEWDGYTKGGYQLRVVGDHVYACGQLNKLFRRDGPGIWTDVSDRQDHPDLFKHMDFIKKRDGGFLNANVGFYAFDGFSESEIYAGGEQTLWAYLNGVWNEMALPEYPRMIDSVLCAGDGQVYVTGRNGPVVRGRNGNWEVMDAPALAYHGMAWFDGKVWLGSDYELGYLEDGQYHRYVFPEEGPAQFSFLSVDACPEMLLSYGPEQALLFDGTEWVEVIGPPLV